MENISRRKFIKFAGLSPLLLVSNSFAIDSSTRVHIFLPEKPFEYFYKEGKEKGGRVLIVGGIHGNEIGAYKASDILIDTEIEKGELIIVPRSNFTSVLANRRGYNGDMNRKFCEISKKDADFKFVSSLKSLIKVFKPDVVLSLHDGYGFHSINERHWGQCLVIDEFTYKQFPLYKIARFVADETNKKILEKKYKIPVYCTKTFSSNKHIEQRKALTGWCLKHDIPAFCLEASKQLPSLKEKIKTHFYMLDGFFKVYGVKIKPSFEYILSNLDRYLNKNNYYINAEINGKLKRIKNYETLKIPKGSSFKVVNFGGSRGVFPVAHGVNLNWKDFYIRGSLTISLKDDYKRIISFNIKVV
jgi:hypothetical protein